MAKKVTREEIEKFVKENLVTANDRRVACGDGRYMPEQSEGAIRAFGADFGIIMAFSATLKDEGTFIDPKEIVERYSRAKKSEFGQDAVFDYHCDSHSHEAGQIGCGHIAKASDPKYDGLYGSINHEDVSKLFDAFTKHIDSQLTVLEGHHEEKAILLVHGHPEEDEVAYSVNSRNNKGDMYFVADIDRTIKLIKRLAPKFSSGLLDPVNPDDVVINYLKQMSATASIIAPNLDQHKVVVSSRGYESMSQLPKQKSQQLNQ